MISLNEVTKLAIKSLLRNKTRSILTMLGIIIGVSAVILLVAIGQGLQNYITTQFESLGSNVIAVLPGKVGGEGGGFSPGSGPNFSGTKLTLKDVADIAKLGGSVESAGAAIQNPTSVSNLGKSKYATIVGADANYLQIRNLTASSGRQVNEGDVRVARNVAVVGSSVAEKLFGTGQVVGKQVAIGGQKFEVIGILSKIGSGGFGIDSSNFVIIPVTSAQKAFGIKGVQSIVANADKKENIPLAISQIKKLLGKRLKEDDFSVLDQASLVDSINQILGVVTLALGGIAAISLVVGGVGIMNIMLVSVTERTREIGLRKAVGAKPQDILIQFLIEAIVLSLGGGMIGVAIGALGAWGVNHFIATSVTFWSVTLAFGVSAAVGVIFGVAPAARASKLNPIEALKYE
ncbi:MAG TPA: ABC transporter permease [Alphaproteobacteria bacterium]|jgi:putative ABC transport system permease protein|nr:ABC transporter permease [Alphaproteobacteria bacterium]